LLLRGAQTPGEIRSRTNRLADFSDVKEVESILENMASPSDGSLVVKLTREAGKRESRYMHLFSGEVDIESFVVSNSHSSNVESDIKRIDALELEVAELKTQLEALRQQVAGLSS